MTRPTYGVLTITPADRQAFANVEPLPDPALRLHFMLAAMRARDDGFPHFAQAILSFVDGQSRPRQSDRK